jgi:hypothetical protein
VIIVPFYTSRWPSVSLVAFFVLRPFAASFNTVAFILRSGIKRKFMQLFTRETLALPAVLFPLCLAAILNGTFRPPKRLFNGKTSFALHDFPPFTLTAKQTASGFDHGSRLLIIP